MKTINQQIVITGTAAERAALVDKDVDDNTLIEFRETDTGDAYAWDGDSWVQTSSAGAAHVSPRNTLNLQTYEADKATSTTSAFEAIPTGAQWLTVDNESTTIAEAVRFIFGDVSVVALATSGHRVRAAGTNVPPGSKRVPVPADATHWAWISESGTPTINVIWE